MTATATATKRAKKTPPPKPANRLHVTPAGRVYKLDGDQIPSVTTILNALPKHLQQWAADAGANYAVEHWSELSEQPLTKRLDAIRYAHRDVRDRAALRGTQVHKYGAALVAGEEVQIPGEYLGPAEAYAKFIDLWEIEPVGTEVPIVNTTHRYGGRGDLWATIGKRDNAFAYVDLKTGNNVYESAVLQCAGYDGAELWQPNGPASEQPYEPVDLLYVAHILPDDVRMLPVKPGQFRAFLYVKQVWHWLDAHGYKGDDPLLGDAVHPDGGDW